MTAPFTAPPARPMISVAMTRDSVCAGDDGDAPHAMTTEVDSSLDPAAFANTTSTGYLASVRGVGHTWTCVLNGVSIAEIGVNAIRPLVNETPFAATNRVHFIYHSATF